MLGYGRSSNWFAVNDAPAKQLSCNTSRCSLPQRRERRWPAPRLFARLAAPRSRHHDEWMVRGRLVVGSGHSIAARGRATGSARPGDHRQCGTSDGRPQQVRPLRGVPRRPGQGDDRSADARHQLGSTGVNPMLGLVSSPTRRNRRRAWQLLDLRVLRGARSKSPRPGRSCCLSVVSVQLDGATAAAPLPRPRR
jgi:hypothetical protein